MKNLLTALLLSAAAFSTTAQTGPYPNKPIRLVVGFAPGGGTDIIARAMAPKLSELLGQQIVIENRAGASGTIGADLVAKSPADGYTLLMGHAISNVLSPNVLGKVPFDPANDFTFLTYIGWVPNVLVLHPAVPAKNVAELISLAKSKPGVLTYASSGIGSTQHLAGTLFGNITKTNIVHIPYKGSGQAVTDLLGGQVTMNFDTMPPILPHAQAGRLRAIAISTEKRMPQLPDVPTFAEVGIKGFDVTNWYSVMGPKGMPRDMILKLDDAIKKTLAEPAVRTKLDPQGVIFSGPKTPEEFGTFVRTELNKYARMVKDLNVKAE